MPINPIDYPGSVGHFRARMDRYLARNGDVFSAFTSEEVNKYKIDYTSIAQTSTREVWHVRSLVPFVNGVPTKEQHDGMILALEELPNKTIVEFIDGAYYSAKGPDWVLLRAIYGERQTNMPPAEPEKVYGEPIGDDFILLAENIKSELKIGDSEFEVTSLPQEPKTRNLDDWFDYLHAVKPRTRIKLQYIAGKTGFSYSTVKKEHSLYIKEKGIQKTAKGNQK